MASTIGGRTLGDLRNTSEVQASERIIPDITDLDPPVAMGNRMREPIVKAIQEVARISWDRKRKGSVEDEDGPLPSEELKRLESQVQRRIPADEDANETVVNRSKRQFNRHCIRFENILKTKTRKVETAETACSLGTMGDM